VLAECVTRGGEHAPDKPKCKCALRFSSLGDPMPRSLPALPGRQAVPPQAATSTVSQAAGQAASKLRETHRRENWKSTLAAPRSLRWDRPDLIRFFDSSDRHWAGAGDEVVKDLHHRGWGLDVREVPDSGEHLKPATRHGVVSGVTVGDRDDPILITPNQQDR
jgi:hypothetical protein